MKHKIIALDPSLAPYAADLDLRQRNYQRKLRELMLPWQSLYEIADGHTYFGFHRTEIGWVYREWAPGAEKMYLTGEFCNWARHAYPMKKGENGVFTLERPGKDALKHGQKVLVIPVHEGQELDRIPLYAKKVVQDPETRGFTAVIHDPEVPYTWHDRDFVPEKELFIYETHIGMAQEEPRVGTYREFTEKILPRVKALGYNTLQIMAIMEHPYYGSFGYQVTNLYAACSRFGDPEDLKALIDAAHGMGIAVLLDVVHSHACINTREGINQFDGTDYQFFHAGPRGDHSAWGTKCYNYDKNEVIRFLLSNLRFWMEEYHFDGFRFDGITSMLYHNHGLGQAFTGPESYFSMNTDTEAVTYLQLATDLIRQVNKNAIIIAEDTSALPGLCLPTADGGLGFDYRLAMGVPDMWIRLLKEKPDEAWNLDDIYYELVVRRKEEKVIGYCESHDQALVGDKTILFRLCDSAMYDSMERHNPSAVVDRGMALHKLLRLITMSLGGEGYLTFMGNEFGHPEWIDFPREGNGWSHHYCRRQWSLADDPNLKYGLLRNFEVAMVKMAKALHVLSGAERQLSLHNDRKTLVYQKGDGIFAFNFHPVDSYTDLFVAAPKGKYKVALASDNYDFGGHGRIANDPVYEAKEQPDGSVGFQIYLPSRTAVVLQKI